MERLPYFATAGASIYTHLRPLPVVVMLDDVRSLYNVGSVFRTADSGGVEKLLLTGITGHPPSNGISKTALGAEKSVPWAHHRDPLQVLDELRQRGYEIASIETSVHSIDLFDWQPAFPVCLVLGNEVEGIRREILDSADLHVRIPSLGVKHSLNVATAAGVVVYEILRKYRVLAETAGELPHGDIKR